MKRSTCFRFSAVQLCVLTAILLAVTIMGERPVRAQGHGISSDARDFYIGYMPGIRHPGGWTGYSENYYVLIGSYQDNNSVTISYFDATGNEFQGQTYVIMKGRCQQILLDRLQMGPQRPGEVLEYKSAHIKSRYPVSVQCYDEGSSTGGMYQAVPTSALGKNYVIASWFDNPIQNNPGFLNRDSSSSEFMIIAAYDNTTVSFVPNSTTYAGVLGYNSGAGSDGKPHPTTISMKRGQVYWVRSLSVDASNDLSGSTVVSDKPIAVLGGQERGLLGDPSGWWLSLDNDIRDVMIEQMTPVEDWGSEYPSIPFMRSTGSTPRFQYLLKNGEGNMYRIYTNDPTGGFMNMWKDYPASPYPTPVNLYQSPAAAYNNIEDPVDLMVDAKSVDPNGNVKKMYAVMYDYFQGAHDSSPGGLADGGKSGGKTQSSGGDDTQDEYTYKCPNEMDLVPIDRWRMSTVFKIPQNSTYRGYQFINIITNRDSLPKITVTHNGLNATPLRAITPTMTYQLPLHPELTGLTLKLAPGDYVINGNTPFACYSYGRTETQYKDGWGYAAPCGEAYGSHTENIAPKADIVPSCDHWDVRLHDTGPGKQEGIADLMLLDDPDGFYTKPGRVSFNTSLNPQTPQFIPGDTSVSFQIVINDPTQNAYAALYVVDRAGNDTVIELHYLAPTVTVSPKTFDLGRVVVGQQACQTFTIKVLATGASPVDTIGVPSWMLNDMSNYGNDPTKKSPTFSWSSSTKLPAALKVGDSVVISVCFAPTDTMDIGKNLIGATAPYKAYGRFDSLITRIGCGFDTIPVIGKGITPIIDASDHDFGTVPIGSSKCEQVSVKNIGNAPLILDKNWKLHNNPDFTFQDQTKLPDTILPGITKKYTFCFSPVGSGVSNSQQDWGTNIPNEYARQKKDTSLLVGRAVQPGLAWISPPQGYWVVCNDTARDTTWLKNTASGPNAEDLHVTKVAIEGPDAAEFSFAANERGYFPLENTSEWPLVVQDSVWILVKFTPNPSKGWGPRNAYAVAWGHGSDLTKTLTDTIRLVGYDRHPDIAITPANYNFGAQRPGTVLTTNFTVTNTGDTDFVVKTLDIVGPGYTVIGGLKVGDIIPAGGSATFTVQSDGSQGGASNAAINMTGINICAAGTAAASEVITKFGVTAIGHQYGVSYICPGNAAPAVVTTSNTGTMWGILRSVSIVADTVNGTPRYNDTAQFTFDDGTRHKDYTNQGIVLGQPVNGGQLVSFPINFTATRRGADTIWLAYNWSDTSKVAGSQDTIIYKMVTAFGYNSANILSIAQPTPTVANGGGYTAVTANSFSIPVRLEQPFTDIDSVFGAQFTVRYLRDQFVFNPNSTTLAPGLSWKGGTAPTPVTDPADNNYELLNATVTSATPITNPQIANATWEYVIAKDSITSFQITKMALLDKDGNPACWVSDSSVSTKFYGTNVCGDFTLRTYLKTGGVAVDIRHVTPNPVTSSARIDFMINEMGVPVSIDVFNALGQNVQTIMKNEVLDQGGYQRDFDASELSSGLYTIRISTPGSEVTKSVLVNK